MNEKSSSAAKTVKVQLLAAHTHRGAEYAQGDQIELRQEQARRLIEAKRAKAP